MIKLSHLHRRAAITAAAVILVAGVVAGRERPTLDMVQERAPARAAMADDGIDLDKLRRGESSLPQTDLFARKNFAPQREVVSAQVQKPTAPPLPFRYFGKLTENGKTEVYVMRDNELITIADGSKLGDYRVDKIADSSIAFTYLPLKTRQTLEIQ